MLRISEHVERAFLQAREDSFRKRALEHAGGADADERTRSWLVSVLDYSESMAERFGLHSERSRLALFVLAVETEPGILETSEIGGILEDQDAPEHVRIRLLIDHLKGSA